VGRDLGPAAKRIADLLEPRTELHDLDWPARPDQRRQLCVGTREGKAAETDVEDGIQALTRNRRRKLRLELSPREPRRAQLE
jgi:hypothetical protein